MENEDSVDASESEQNEQNSDQEEQDSDDEKSQERDSDYDSDDSSDYSDDVDETLEYRRPGYEIPDEENTPELNIKRFTELLESKRMKKQEEEDDKKYVYYEDLFNFPKDPENWREEDLKELWADAPLEMTKPGWDPVWADEEDWDIVRDEMKAGRDPPIAPFYVPYRKPYPAIPDDHYDISNPKAVIEELDRIEEFLTWVSYIFPDGSSYEGTVWDDLAHGKGVYVAEEGLVRYEGEWLQNNMEGHGVVEVDIPDVEPVPGSKLEEQMREEGKIISRDYMTSEDKDWLEKDIEDIMQLADGNYEIPFYERDEWIKYFGAKPEVGRYRYAGQWKQGRMHGCGVYEINERTIYGRFYFGELLEDSTGCDEDTSALHSGIAEVAAAKARMFVNKPDGMVREERGPYNDPQHPYFYEEEDVWMAPGFINQFSEVPDYWKTYVHEVDHERELWLNSFYKAPLRLPMPAELEYWWSQDQTPEFVLLNKEPEPDPEDPSKLIYTEDPLILHTPTGRIINYIEDENQGVRLFWQPPLKEGEDVDPEKAEFLPLGFDEFYGTKEVENRENFLTRFVLGVENSVKSSLEKLEKWTEEKKKDSEVKMQVIEKELELVEAEICLEEAIEEMEEDLKKKEIEEEKKLEMGFEVKEDPPPSLTKEDEKSSVGQEEEEEEDDEEEEEEDEDDGAPSSFGSVTPNKDHLKNGQKGNKPGSSPFSSTTLSFASSCLVSGGPSKLLRSFLPWRKFPSTLRENPSSHRDNPISCSEKVSSVNFPRLLNMKESLRASKQIMQGKTRTKKHSNGMKSELHSISQILLHSSSSSSICLKRSPKKQRKVNNSWVSEAPEVDSFDILSLHTPVSYLELYVDTTTK